MTWEQIIRDANNAWLRELGLPELNASGPAIGSETTLAASLDRTDARPAGPEVGSPLYTSLLKGNWREQKERMEKFMRKRLSDASPEPEYEGPCAECGHMTDERDEKNDDFCHHACRMDVARSQARDHAADDPRRGQAREINAKFWDIP